MSESVFGLLWSHGFKVSCVEQFRDRSQISEKFCMLHLSSICSFYFASPSNFSQLWCFYGNNFVVWLDFMHQCYVTSVTKLQFLLSNFLDEWFSEEMEWMGFGGFFGAFFRQHPILLLNFILVGAFFKKSPRLSRWQGGFRHCKINDNSPWAYLESIVSFESSLCGMLWKALWL